MGFFLTLEKSNEENEYTEVFVSFLKKEAASRGMLKKWVH